MKIDKFQRHKSSQGFIAAKYPTVLMYILSSLVLFIPYVGIFAWLIAFLFFFRESDSKFLRVHSAQNGFLLMLYSVVELILSIIGGAILSSANESMNQDAIISALITQGNLGNAARIIRFIILVINIVFVLLAYNYRFFNIPVLGKLAYRLHDRTDSGPLK